MRELSIFRDFTQEDDIWVVRTNRTSYRCDLSYEDASLSVSGPGLHRSFDLRDGVLSQLIDSEITDCDLVLVAVLFLEANFGDQDEL